MKRIIAFLKPNMLDDVIFALHRIEDFPGATVSEVRDIGRGAHHHVGGAPQRRRAFGFPVTTRLEIICAADRTEEIVSTIASEAHTGLPDDGEIVICSVEYVLPICAGEHKEEPV
ncbi:MAG: P-II family nitrogen regulator [Lentisphaeria bacterium]|nr:P-II family nitrogen regulator [Lentisphaeria bacterium]